MAFSFIVEDGSGKSDATSYTTVSYADDYVTKFLADDPTWVGATTAAKENALCIGTAYIDNKYRTRWKGRAVSSTQALAWPRYDVCTYDGFIVDSNEIPDNLQRAAVEAAVRDINGTALEPDATPDERSVKRLRLKFDVFEKDTEYTSGRSSQPLFITIDRLLQDYTLTGSGGQVFADRG